MAYETHQVRRQKVRYDDANSDNALRYQLQVNGAKVTPTSGTITIYRPGNSTALVDAAAMTVSGTMLTYSVDTTTEASWPIEEGYRAELAVVASGTTYKRVILFDVVRFLLDLGIAYDQLVAYDDRLRDVQWDGDEDLSEVILACRDVLQTRIEAKVIGDGGLVENMILDHSRVAVAARDYILAHIWRVKGHDERADYYKAQHDALWDAVLSTIRFDEGQDGEEDSEAGKIQEVRLVQ